MAAEVEMEKLSRAGIVPESASSECVHRTDVDACFAPLEEVLMIRTLSFGAVSDVDKRGGTICCVKTNGPKTSTAHS